MVGASSSLGSYYAASFEVGRARRGRHCRSTVVLPRKQGTVLACGVLMLHLRRHRSPMRFACEGLLLRCRTRGYSALPAVECDVRIVVYDDRLVIDIGHVRDIHIGHRAVVEEMAAAPFPACEAFAEVSEAVINAAIKPDVRAPIASIPKIEAIVPTPISGGPQIAHFGSYHPGARHPIVAVIVAPRPISGCPQISRAGANGLGVDWQRGRADSHRNANPNLCRRWGSERRWNHQQQESERQEPNYTLQLHFVSLRARWACLRGSTRRLNCLKHWRRTCTQPVVCPDEGLIYLNT